jgi:hypothetical protein
LSTSARSRRDTMSKLGMVHLLTRTRGAGL